MSHTLEWDVVTVSASSHLVRVMHQKEKAKYNTNLGEENKNNKRTKGHRTAHKETRVCRMAAAADTTTTTRKLDCARMAAACAVSLRSSGALSDLLMSSFLSLS